VKEGRKLGSASFYVTIALNEIEDSVRNCHRTIPTGIAEIMREARNESHAVPFTGPLLIAARKTPKRKRKKK
jgi:hypothetical protein